MPATTSSRCEICGSPLIRDPGSASLQIVRTSRGLLTLVSLRCLICCRPHYGYTRSLPVPDDPEHIRWEVDA